MKRLFYLFLLLAVACSQKPEGFIIQGELTGFEDSTMLYLTNPDSQEDIDSSLIIDGKFQFEGKLTEPKRLYVSVKYEQGKDYKYTSFFVENTLIKVKGDYDNFMYCNILGSKSQDIENILIEKIKIGRIERDSLSNYYFKNRNDITEEEQNNIWQKISVLDSLRDIQTLIFVKENINSYAALEKLQWRMSEISKDTLKKYYMQLTPEFKASEDGKILNVFLNSRIVKIGEDFIDFSAVTLNGNEFNLSDVKTDYILLDFWAGGCGPCRMANKELAKHYDDLKDKMEIVSFSLDVKKEWIEKASKQDSITWINVTDYKGRNSSVAVQYKISGIPCSYLINKERKVIKKYLGYDPEFIDELKTVISSD